MDYPARILGSGYFFLATMEFRHRRYRCSSTDASRAYIFRRYISHVFCPSSSGTEHGVFIVMIAFLRPILFTNQLCAAWHNRNATAGCICVSLSPWNLASGFAIRVFALNFSLVFLTYNRERTIRIIRITQKSKDQSLTFYFTEIQNICNWGRILTLD